MKPISLSKIAAAPENRSEERFWTVFDLSRIRRDQIAVKNLADVVNDSALHNLIH